jgi:hypothetical protein
LRTGTKTVLFGYHQFLLHPLLVAAAWWKLYGFPYDPRLWFAFFLHDIGYLGKRNIDGFQGQLHPFTGAILMGFFFDDAPDGKWENFCLYHSRTIAKAFSAPLSKLGFADKLAFLLYPKWLLRVLYFFSGELDEYLKNCGVETWEEWYAIARDCNRKTLDELNCCAEPACKCHTTLL